MFLIILGKYTFEILLARERMEIEDFMIPQQSIYEITSDSLYKWNFILRITGLQIYLLMFELF